MFSILKNSLTLKIVIMKKIYMCSLTNKSAGIRSNSI